MAGGCLRGHVEKELNVFVPGAGWERRGAVGTAALPFGPRVRALERVRSRQRVRAASLALVSRSLRQRGRPK